RGGGKDARQPPPPEPAVEEEEAPAPKRTTRTAGNGAGAKKSNTKMYAIIGGVAGVLLLSCCCLGGVGSWFFFLRGGPEKTIIGKWGFDAEAFKKNAKNKEAADFMAGMLSQMQLEIKSDNTMTFGLGGKTESGKWKLVKTESNTVFLDTKQDSGTKDEWSRQE